MIDIDKLRRLAQAVISKMNALDPEFVSSVTPLAVLELLDRLEAAEEERDTYKAVCNEWIAKTEWVQDELHRRKLYGKYLGMHRADIIKVEIDALRAAVRHEADCVDAAKAEIDALRAKIEEMEKQEPVGWIYTVNGGWDCYSPMKPTKDAYDTGSLMPRYALPGARSQPAPSVREGWKLVPIEPTEDMLRAMTDPFVAINGDNRKAFESAYTAMLAVAPEAKP